MSEKPAMYRRELPWVQTVDKNTPYPVCTCGRTGTPPRCDGSGPEGGCQPHEHLAERKRQLFICGCGRSGKLPFCDGTHNQQQGKTPGELIREFIRNPFK